MLLKELCECSGAPGDEQEVRQRIIDELIDMGYSYQVDSIGNVIVHHDGERPASKLLWVAHMDEPAIMIYDITEDGFLRFKTIGSIGVPRQLSGRTVCIGREVKGVVGFAPYHMMKISQECKNASATHQHIDIGVSSREEALQKVRIGDYAVFDSPFLNFGDDKYKGKAMKSRVGCYALLELLRDPPKMSFDVAFTTMYEVGLRGIEVAVYTQEPDFVISVGTVASADCPGSVWGEGCVELGQGVCISQMDAGIAYSRDLVNKLCDMAEAAGIHHRPILFNEEVALAGAATLCSTGAVPISLLVPCRHPSSAAGVVNKSDLADTIAMMRLIAEHT